MRYQAEIFVAIMLTTKACDLNGAAMYAVAQALGLNERLTHEELSSYSIHDERRYYFPDGTVAIGTVHGGDIYNFGHWRVKRYIPTDEITADPWQGRWYQPGLRNKVRVDITPGETKRITIGFSEAACHLRIAGRTLNVCLGDKGLSAQVYDENDQPISFPILSGEAGIYREWDTTYYGYIEEGL